MSTVLQQIDRFALASSASGAKFQISVSTPDPTAGDRRPRSLPILFVLDADTTFGTVAEAIAFRSAGDEVQPAVVVGVGYGMPTLQMLSRRTVDLTPGGEVPDHLTGVVGTDTGRGDQLLDFLLDELAPEILRRYPEAAPDRHVLLGHSLGGLLVSHALLTRPTRFAGFGACSPSLWWNGFAVLDHLPGLGRALDDAPRRPDVFVSIGSREQDLPTDVPDGLEVDLDTLRVMVASSRMVDAAAEFAQSLREAGLSDTTYVLFHDEDHSSVVPAALSRAVGVLLPPSSMTAGDRFAA